MMTTVILSGELGHQWGRRHVLYIATPAEALRLIEANRPGLVAYLANAGDRGIDFRVTVGKEPLRSPEMVQFAARGRTIRISPVVRGSKDKWVGVVAGVALVGLSWGAGAGYLTGIGITKGMAGAAAFGINGLSWGALVGGVGLSMAVGGVAQMLAPSPRFEPALNGSRSDLFGGPVNATVQGLPVPLVYGGPILVG